MSDLSEKVRAIQLDWTVQDGMVVVTPRDEDRFSIRLNDAIEILRKADKEKPFRGQLKLLMKQLAEWLRDRDDVRTAYLTIRDGAFAFVVIRTSVAYDEAFEDELSELDFRIANDPDLTLISLHTMSLPSISAAASQSFLDNAFTLEYPHGSGS